MSSKCLLKTPTQHAVTLQVTCSAMTSATSSHAAPTHVCGPQIVHKYGCYQAHEDAVICLQSSGAQACRSVFLSRSLYIMICRAGPDLAGLAGRRGSHADGQTAVEGGRLGRRRGVGVGVARPIGVPSQRSAHLHLRPGAACAVRGADAARAKEDWLLGSPPDRCLKVASVSPCHDQNCFFSRQAQLQG